MLDRVPDDTGLHFWTESVLGGQSLQNVASAFLDSAEYQARLGTRSHAAFIDDGALGRDPDAGSLAIYQAALATGTSRAAVAAQIVGSPEALAFHLPNIEHGWHIL